MLRHAPAQVNLESMPEERDWAQESMSLWSHLYGMFRTGQSAEAAWRLVIARGWVAWEKQGLLMRAVLYLMVMNLFRN